MKQNIGLTFLFAALNGIGNTLAALVLVVENDRIESGMPSSKARNIAALIVNLILQFITLVFGMISPWFGPASLFLPTSLCSQLLSNMICFGFVLKREDLNKETQVATYTILIAVLLLPVVGPGAQDVSSVQFPPDPRQNPLSTALMIFFLAIFTVSLAVIIVKDLKKMRNDLSEMWLIAYTVAVGTLYPTFSRAFSISSGGARVGFMAAFLVVSLSWCFQAIVEAKCVTSRTKYIPTKLCTNLFFNAINGIIVWEDWRVMMSWMGYICTFMLMVLGVYLMSTLEFFIVTTQERRNAMIAKQTMFTNKLRRPRRRSSLPTNWKLVCQSIDDFTVDLSLDGGSVAPLDLEKDGMWVHQSMREFSTGHPAPSKSISFGQS